MSADPAFIDEDASSGSGEDMNVLDGHNKNLSATPSAGRRKRSRKATGDAIVDAMLEIAAASKMRAAAIMRNEERFAISKCIKVLDEMQGVDQSLYFFALDLFENPSARETFISLKNERRLAWLRVKFNASSSSTAHTSISMEDDDIGLDEMELVAAAAGYYYHSLINKQPTRGILPAGCGFMTELLSGSDDLCREMLRMDKHVFLKLCNTLRERCLLRDTAGVMIEEQVAIFLNVIGHNERNRVLQERFRHSGETVSRHFNNVLKAVKSLSREFLQPLLGTTPAGLMKSKRFYPYFKDCIGVIDGMHIPAHVPAKDQSRFRNRKGILSQNVLVACTFHLEFVFTYPGWEGSAADSRVLRAALNDPDQKFPQVQEGKYYIVDRGFANEEGFIAPFQGVRYHPDQFKGANQIPRNAKELFNHRHSFLRSAIQKSFDVLKARFPILKIAPQYAFHIQRDIVIAACVIHNHIRHEEPNDWLFASMEGGGLIEDLPELDEEPDPPLTFSVQEQVASAVRDSISITMWNDFVNAWNEW